MASKINRTVLVSGTARSRHPHRGNQHRPPRRTDTPTLPLDSLLDAIPRTRGRYWVTNSGHGRIATGRRHYCVVTTRGRIVRISDNLLDILRLIDGQRSIRDITAALATLQRRPVHPTEVIYLIHKRLASAHLVDLSPVAPRAQAAGTSASAHAQSSRLLLALPPNPDPRLARQTHRLAPASQRGRTSSHQPAPPMRAALSPGGRAAATVIASIFIFAIGAGLGLGLGHHGQPFGSQPSALARPAAAATQKSAGASATATPNPYLTTVYRWRAGDTLASVAARFHLPPQILLAANNLASGNGIQPGTALVIPSFYRPGLDPSQMQHPVYYIVQPGDTISSIAVKFNTTIYDISDANNITGYTLIYPGQGLLIP